MRNYLVGRGVAVERLEAVGAGDEEDYFDQSRQVEFVIVSSDD